MAQSKREKSKLLEAEKEELLERLNKVEWALIRIEKGQGGALRFHWEDPNFPNDPAKWRAYRKKHPINDKGMLLRDRTILRDLIKNLGKKRRPLETEPIIIRARPKYERDRDEFVNTRLQRQVRRMRDNPTEANISRVLDSIGLGQLNGTDPDGHDEALEAVGNAVEIILSDRINELASNPSTRNCRRTLEMWGAYQLIGGDPASEILTEAHGAVMGATRKRTRSAERKFRERPTSDNLGRALDERANNHLMGGDLDFDIPGWSGAGMLEHTVARGETLSGLSKRYYGQMGFWDVIYLANLAKIDHPDVLPHGVVLSIP